MKGVTGTAKAFSHSLVVTGSLLALPLAVAPSLADQPAAAGASSSEGTTGSLQEIVVTAQRKSEGILSVPMSIQANTGEELNAAGITDSTHLAMITPGMLVSDATGYSQVYIRGVGNSIFVGADPSVATYIDDVPHIYGSSLTNFVNVQRVEVLKGAQGGLYGRNATGGVINIITNQPTTDKFSALFRGSYGQLGTYQVAGDANIPVNDMMALNLAIERDAHAYYIANKGVKNPYTAAMFPGGSELGNDATTAAALNSGVLPPAGYNDQSYLAAQGKLLIKPLDTLKFTLASDYSHKTDNDGNAFSDPTPAYNQASLAGFLSELIGANPVLPAGFIQGTGKFTTSMGMDGPVNTLDYGGSLTALWNASGVDVTSISAYRVNDTHLITNLAASTVPILSADVTIDRQYFYQELRGVSTFDGPLHLLGGATYLQTHVGAHSFTGFFNLIHEPLAATVDHVENWSVYGQAGYDLTQALNLTASGRYVHEQNTATYSYPPTPGEAKLSEDKFLPSATLSYKFEQGGNIYARWARGFKSGGINPVVSPESFPDPNTQGGIFQGEEVDTYEIGYRAPLLDHAMEVTTAIFYNDYKNLQTAAHANEAHVEIIEAIVNAGTARTYGAEAGVEWRVLPPLTIGLNGGYLNAKYKNFQIPDSNPVLVPFNLDGQTMLNSPEWQGSFTGNLDQPLNAQWNLIGNVVVSYTDSLIFIQSGAPGVLPDADAPAYWLANVRAGVRTADDRVELTAYCNNISNSTYYTYGSSAASTGNLLTWGNPRIFGGQVQVRF
jgi:iron complex outermembrane receptor protein